MSEQANHNLAHGLHITTDMLMGRGHFEGIDNQLQYPLQAYQQIAISGKGLPVKGEKTLELTSILQVISEPYQEFVACLLQNIGRTMVDTEAGNILVKQLAIENAISPVRKPFGHIEKELLCRKWLEFVRIWG
jgi:hypothetical protein